MSNAKISIFVSLLVSLLVGCATGKLAEEQHEAITAIYIDDEVQIPREPTFQGTLNSLMLSGFVGSLIDEVADNRGELISSYMKKNQIVIGEIAREGVLSVLRNNPILSDKKFVENIQDADSVLNIGIFMYGLGEVGGFTGLYKPQLGIAAELTDSHGRRLWGAGSSVTINTESMPKYPLGSYFKDPEVMRDSFTRAAVTIGMMLSEKLHE